MPLPPVANEVHVRDSAPCDGTGVLGDDHLKLFRHSIDEARQNCEDTANTLYIAVDLLLTIGNVLHRWPCFWEVHLRGLIDDQEARHWALGQTNEVFMKSQQACDVVSEPVLTAADLPKEIRATRKRAELKGELSNVQTNVLRSMFKLEQTRILGDPR